MNGFASGFSQGMNSITNLLRLKDASEYRDKELGLRQARMDQDDEHWQKDFGLRDADQQYRHDDGDRKYQLDQDRLEETKDQNQRTYNLGLGNLGVARDNAASLKDYRQHMSGEENRKNKLAKLQPIAQQAISIIQGGGELPESMIKTLSDPDSPFNPQMVASQDYVNNLDGLIQSVNADPEKWNTPENVKRAGVIFAPELGAMTGKVDPGTGKKVKGSSFTRFVPSPDGKHLVPEIRMDYADGSHAVTPLTKFRSTHPDDPIVSIPLDHVSQQVWARKAWQYLISHDKNVQAIARGGKGDKVNPGVKAVLDLKRDKIEAGNDIAAKSIDPEQSRAQQEQSNKNYDHLIKEAGEAYGLPASDNDANQSDIQRAVIMRQPGFEGFAKDMLSRKNPIDVTKIENPEDLAEMFTGWLESQKKEMKASSSADIMRRGYSGANGR